MSETGGDQGQAAREAEARGRLLAAGGAGIPRGPWLRDGQPPAAVDLIQHVLWRARTGPADEDGIEAALALLPAARAEIDQIEAALLFTARAGGLSWPRISRAMGLGSAQAAQQRFDRVTGRVEGR